MSRDKDAQRANAEARFKRQEEKASAATEAKAEHEAGIVARDANTKRLKALRLAKEQADRDSVQAAPPKKAPAKKRAEATPE